MLHGVLTYDYFVMIRVPRRRRRRVGATDHMDRDSVPADVHRVTGTQTIPWEEGTNRVAEWGGIGADSDYGRRMKKWHSAGNTDNM
jgi:hypothetical protein